jgi:hypothetical protein
MRLERTARIHAAFAALYLGLTTAGFCGEGGTLFSYKLKIPERNDVDGYILHTKNYRVSFIPPTRWSVRHNPTTGWVTLLPSGLEAGIGIKVTARRLPEDAAVVSLDRLKEEIRVDHPDAVFTGESSCSAGDVSGWVVEFECQITKGTARTAFRRALFDFDGGVVESELRVARGKIKEFRSAHSRVLSSLGVRFPVNRANLAFGPSRPSEDAPTMWSE